MKVFCQSLFLFLPLFLSAQDTTAVVDLGDTTIYQFADEAPRFPTRCERYDTTALAKAECAQAYMLDYVYGKIVYPPEARENNVSGTAVVSFIVERNGFINRPEVLRDPGSGIGNAALKAVAQMQRELLWRPAMKDGEPVRYKFILPVRFRLEEPKPYVTVGRDTIYTELTRPVQFTGMEGKLTDYFDAKLQYPPAYADSCYFGQMDVQLLIEPSGLVRVQDIIDYNDLGVDFTTVAIDAATGSYGNWVAGEYEGRPVRSAYNVSFSFVPESEVCATRVEEYFEALQLVQSGQEMATDSTTLDAGLDKISRAIDLFPADGRFRIVRGQLLMDNNRLGEACVDLRLAGKLALVDWYDSVLPLICQGVEPEEE